MRFVQSRLRNLRHTGRCRMPRGCWADTRCFWGQGVGHTIRASHRAKSGSAAWESLQKRRRVHGSAVSVPSLFLPAWAPAGFVFFRAFDSRTTAVRASSLVYQPPPRPTNRATTRPSHTRPRVSLHSNKRYLNSHTPTRLLSFRSAGQTCSSPARFRTSRAPRTCRETRRGACYDSRRATWSSSIRPMTPTGGSAR